MFCLIRYFVSAYTQLICCTLAKDELQEAEDSLSETNYNILNNTDPVKWATLLWYV